MKKCMLIALSIIGILTMSSCGKNLSEGKDEIISDNIQSEETQVDSQEDNDSLFEIQKEEKFGFVSVGIKDNKYSYTYDGESVIINYQYAASEETCFGIMILCDGIATPFTTDKTDGEAILQIVPNINDENIDVVLSFVPIGKKGDRVSVEIMDIVEPDFNVTKLDLTEELLPLIHGQKYNVKSIGGIWVSMQEDGLTNTATVNEKNEFKELNEDELSEYRKEDENLGGFVAKYQAEGTEKILYSLNQGDVLDIEITYFGTNGQDIYTSFYIDKEIASVFEGADYNKCYIDNAHKTVIHARIDTQNMTKGTHICYSMCGNIEFCNYNPTKPFILQVN